MYIFGWMKLIRLFIFYLAIKLVATFCACFAKIVPVKNLSALFYHFALETSPQAAIFPYDALKDGQAVLLAYENDLEKLKGFKAGLEQFEERGLVICLAEQLEMLSQYFAHLADIQTIPANLLEKALNSE